jgi:hypothetical protein
MNLKLFIKILPIFALFIFDFSFQNFNPITFQFVSCKLYVYSNTCCTFQAFALNKLLRLLLNLFTIKLIFNNFNFIVSNKIYYIITFLCFYVFDMFLCYSMHPLFINWHKVLNPVLYSPLIGVALLAWFISNIHKQNS